MRLTVTLPRFIARVVSRGRRCICTQELFLDPPLGGLEPRWHTFQARDIAWLLHKSLP